MLFVSPKQQVCVGIPLLHLVFLKVFSELLGCHWIQSCVPENSEHSLHVSFAAGSSIVIMGEKNQKENNQKCNCPACKDACSNDTVGSSSSSSSLVRQFE